MHAQAVEVNIDIAPWYSQEPWKFRRAVTLNQRMIAGELRRFPVLVQLSSDKHLAEHARADGDDIYFTDAAGKTRLDHELESFNRSSGRLAAWVRIPRLSPANKATIYLYYGSRSAKPQGNPTGTWDRHFRGVWHLDETQGLQLDSTRVGSHGPPEKISRLNAVGRIGGCLGFDAVVGQAVIIHNEADFDFVVTNAFTLEAWVQAERSEKTGTIVAKRVGIGHFTGYEIVIDHEAGGVLAMTLHKSGRSTATVSGTTRLDDGKWHHVAGVHTGGGRTAHLLLYVDGHLEKKTIVRDALDGKSILTDVPATIGAREKGRNPFLGLIDEVRISTVARSAAWIATAFSSQADPSAFSHVGKPETVDRRDSGAAGWTGRKRITLQPPAGEVRLRDFPVLVSLVEDRNLAAAARPDGEDLVFTLSDGVSPLDHEITHYDPKTGQLQAWVRMPELRPGAAASFYMYYGNPGVRHRQHSSGVWKHAYRAVWHLDEAAANGRYAHRDATGNGNTGMPKGLDGTANSTSDARGIVGGANVFGGPGDSVMVPDSDSLDVADELSVEAWIHTDKAQVQMPRIVTREAATAWALGFKRHSKYAMAVMLEGAERASTEANIFEEGEWTHVAFTYSRRLPRDQVRLYVNGNEAARGFYTFGVGSNDSDIHIGGIKRNALYSFRGSIDEVRISGAAMPPGWIQTTYRNISQPGAFMSIGPETKAGLGAGGAKEGDRRLSVGVRLSKPSKQPVSVQYETADGTAKQGLDFKHVTGTLRFEPGETKKMIVIPLIDDHEVEPDETLIVNLLDADGAELGGQRRYVFSVGDNDIPLADGIFVDDDAKGANNGSSWRDAFSELTPALKIAAGSGRNIYVAEGTYRPTRGADRTASFVLAPGTTLYGGFRGNETAISGRDWTKHKTILSGDIGTPGTESDNSIHVIVGAPDATLDGFVVMHGHAVGKNPDERGAGLYQPGAMTLRNCRFTENRAKMGGAISTKSGASAWRMETCRFDLNHAENYGGALFWGTVTAIDCVFSNNTAGRGYAQGGSMHTTVGRYDRCVFENHSGMIAVPGAYHATTFDACVFRNNATWCIYSNSGKYYFQNCIFRNNGEGVWLRVPNLTSLDMDRCLFVNTPGTCLRLTGKARISRSVFTRSGTAILDEGSTLKLDASVFAGVTNGCIRTTKFANHKIINSIFSGNTGGIKGGCVFLWEEDRARHIEIANCTIARNSTPGSIVQKNGDLGDVSLRNSIVWDNGLAPIGGTFLKCVNSNIEGGHAGASINEGDPDFTPTISGTWTEAAVFDASSGQSTLVDARSLRRSGFLTGRFLNPAVTGNDSHFYIVSNSKHGITVWGDASSLVKKGDAYEIYDYHLQPDSPCIDSGSQRRSPDTDFDGNPRPEQEDGKKDIGAYEFSPRTR
jgi:hypothetical protein